MVLETLQLQQFGRFTNDKFSFKPCTVFWGKNESGKTTVLDALFLALLDRQTNSSTVQMLNNRYGANFRVSIEPSLVEKSLSLAELENFYVVRSSRLQIDFSGSANSGVIKSKLLETTLNIESLITEITRDTGSRAKDSYGNLIKEKHAAKQQLESEIKSIETVLNSYIPNAVLYKNNLATIKKINDEIAAIKQKTETIDQRLVSLKEQERTLSIVLLREKAQAWLQRAEEYTEKKQKFDLVYGDFDSAQIEKMLNAEAELRETIEKKTIENQKKEEKIKNYKYLQPKIKSLLAYIVASVVLGLAGVGLLVFGAASKTLIALISGFICLLLASVSVLVRYLISNSYIAEIRRIFEDNSIRIFEDAHKLAKLHEEEIKQSGLSEYLQKIETVQKQKNAMLQKLNLPHEQALRKFSSDKNAVSMELKTLYKTALETVPISDFNAAGIAVTYPDDVAGNSEHIGSLLAVMQAIKRALNSLPQAQHEAQGGSQQVAGIKQEIVRLEETKKRYEYDQNRMLQQKDTLIQKQTELVKLLAGFDHTAEAHDKAMIKLQEVQNELDQLTRENEALAIVLNILQAIAHTMKQELNFIKKDLHMYFSDIVPAFKNIIVSDVNPEKIKMPDIQNEIRPVNLLSQGTQDIFYLGFRMLLGSYLWEEGVTADSLPKSASQVRPKQKKRQKPGFFLWDEPFTALDADRLKLAIAMLKKFQELTGFQHVIFTKDEFVVTEITRQWSQDALIVHNL